MNLTMIIAMSAVIAAVNIKCGDESKLEVSPTLTPEKTGEVAANVILASNRDQRISYRPQSESNQKLITERALARILFEDSKAEVTSLKPQARRVKNVAVAQQVAALRNGRQNSCGSREQSGGRYFSERLENPTNRRNWKQS